MKTSAVAVRSVLRDGLENPSRYQTARTGLAALKAVKLYRDGRKEDTSRFAPSPSLAAREGDDTLGAGRPFLGALATVARRWTTLRVVRSAMEH